MADAHARQPTSIEVFAVVTRADGTVQDQGLVSATYSWRKPIKKLLWPLRKRQADRRIKAFNPEREE